MSRAERVSLKKLLLAYKKVEWLWPDNRRVLQDVIALLRTARVTREMISRVRSLCFVVEDGGDGETTVTPSIDTKNLMRETLAKMKAACCSNVPNNANNKNQQSKKMKDDVRSRFAEEVTEYVWSIDALVVDSDEQTEQLIHVFNLWDSECTCDFYQRQ
jgi:hypothetical protein